MIKQIYVSQNAIDENKKAGKQIKPEWIVRTPEKDCMTHSVETFGYCRTVTDYKKETGNVAQIWIETEGDVVIDNGEVL